MRDQRTLFDLTQDGLVIGNKIQRIYPEFDVDAFVRDVRTEMEGQTLYNVTNAIGQVLRQHLSKDYSEALAILMDFVDCLCLRRFVLAAHGRNGSDPVLALLEILKDDSNGRVREHVAIDMRDIVKDYPEAGYATLERWRQDGQTETEKILRQALKYQVKIGDKRAFKLLGMGVVPKLSVAPF